MESTESCHWNNFFQYTFQSETSEGIGLDLSLIHISCPVSGWRGFPDCAGYGNHETESSADTSSCQYADGQSDTGKGEVPLGLSLIHSSSATLANVTRCSQWKLRVYPCLKLCARWLSLSVVWLLSLFISRMSWGCLLYTSDLRCRWCDCSVYRN